MYELVNWNIQSLKIAVGNVSPCSSNGSSRDSVQAASAIRECSESAFRLTFCISTIICDKRSSACLDNEPSCLITPVKLLTKTAPRSARTASSSCCLPKYRGSICLWSSGMLTGGGELRHLHCVTAPIAVYVCATAVYGFIYTRSTERIGW